METKTIPFDLETAKKIQAGEIEGRIINSIGTLVEIVSFNVTNTPTSIVGIVHYPQADSVIYIRKNGTCFNSIHDIIVEFPEEASKYEFKPFDKVLVRSKDETNNKWFSAIYAYYDDVVSHITIDHKMYANGDCIPYEGNEHLVGTTDKPKEG